MTLDLRQLVIDEIDNSDEPDPKTIAKAVANQIDAAELRDAVEQLLPEMVTGIFRSDRRKPPTSVAVPSSRWEAAGDAYQALLHTRLFASGGWKLLRDCTHVDILSAAADRRKQADENIAWAERYEKLAKKMRTAKARTVSEMPAEVVVEAIG